MIGERKKLIITYCTVLCIIVIVALLDLSYAPKPLSISDVINVIMGNGKWSDELIVQDNAKRIVMAIFIGAGLAVSGAVMQAMFKNPMASPYLLGLSSGASFGAALAILITIPFIPALVARPALAFITCMFTLFIVYNVARVGGHVKTETLLLTGIAVSAMMSAFVSFMTFIAGDNMQEIVFWNMGGLYKAEFEQALVIGPIIILGILLMYTYSKELNAMMLGDHHAMDLGVDVSKTRLILLVTSGLVTAAAVAFVGTIGFIGLVIPHIFRLILGPDNKRLIPVAALGGAAFLLSCDYLSYLFSNYYGALPVGVLTAMVGAPYFLYLLRRRKKEVGW